MRVPRRTIDSICICMHRADPTDANDYFLEETRRQSQTHISNMLWPSTPVSVWCLVPDRPASRRWYQTSLCVELPFCRIQNTGEFWGGGVPP